MLTPQQRHDDARLAEIENLHKQPIGHKHCPRCGACLTTGEVHAPCTEITEYDRTVSAFKHLARTRK